MKIVHVVGARPNFMKVAPVMTALTAEKSHSQVLVHTGQHYDRNMSAVFFEELGIPSPDINLEVGSGSHAWQTGQTMLRIEKVLLEEQPQLVVVYGDVNSTVAVALVCAKLLLPLAHVEAGLRSRDRTMPEEVNRLVTDQLATLLFTPSIDANENLAHEGVPSDRIHLVGNVMIDTLARCVHLARKPNNVALPDRYALVTIHRPSNVDDHNDLVRLLDTLRDIGRQIDVVFPLHPRTRQQLASNGWDGNTPGIHFLEPAGYLEFIYLQREAAMIVTDSGGVQEESTWLGVPCITVRENTERPITVSMGTNVLVGKDPIRLKATVSSILSGEWKRGRIPPLWDGKASERIAHIIETIEQPQVRGGNRP